MMFSGGIEKQHRTVYGLTVMLKKHRTWVNSDVSAKAVSKEEAVTAYEH